MRKKNYKKKLELINPYLGFYLQPALRTKFLSGHSQAITLPRTFDFDSSHLLAGSSGKKTPLPSIRSVRTATPGDLSSNEAVVVVGARGVCVVCQLTLDSTCSGYSLRFFLYRFIYFYGFFISSFSFLGLGCQGFWSWTAWVAVG